MDTGKVYHDSNGNECSIWQAVRREPDWAAIRVQEGEKAIERVKELEKRDAKEFSKRELDFLERIMAFYAANQMTSGSRDYAKEDMFDSIREKLNAQ